MKSVGKLTQVELNVLDYDIVVREFELQSRYDVHFWKNTLNEGMNSFISLAMG